VPSAKVVRAGILRWWMLLITNSLDTPEVAPLSSMMRLETPVALVTVFGLMYILFKTATSLVLLPEKLPIAILKQKWVCLVILEPSLRLQPIRFHQQLLNQ